MPSFEPRFSINMETSLPAQVTTVDQDSPARQIGCGGKGESFRTISAAFPPRSGFVQPFRRADRFRPAASSGDSPNVMTTPALTKPRRSGVSPPNSVGRVTRNVARTTARRAAALRGRASGPEHSRINSSFIYFRLTAVSAVLSLRPEYFDSDFCLG